MRCSKSATPRNPLNTRNRKEFGGESRRRPCRKQGTNTYYQKVQIIEQVINRQLQPVVRLRNIFAGYTLTKNTVTTRKNEDGSQGTMTVHCSNRQAVESSSPRKFASVLLSERGLCDFKLSETVPKSEKLVTLTEADITQLLVDAVSLGNAPNRHNRPFELDSPHEECAAIVEALRLYSACVPPWESRDLYERSEGNKKVRKGWIFVTTLGRSEFFARLKLVPGRKHAFEKKMLSIMKASTEVDVHNWTLSEVGYILAFWLVKLYNNLGISEENIPKMLILAKEHFLELRGWHYEDAIII